MSATTPSTTPSSPAAPRRSVLVTGAGRRIGRTIALDLAAQGWDLAVHCHRSVADGEDTVAAARALGVQATLLVADLADEAACNALVPQAVAALGRLDAVVNNASLFVYDSVADCTQDNLARHWQANTAPAIFLARALHAHLLARGAAAGAGCVVNLLDQKLANPNPDYFSYTLSKAALESANTLLAMALAPLLRVCAVSPGVTLTSGPMTEAEFTASHRMTPLQRSSTPEDIARAVRYLLDAPAITGTTLLVDGGQHLQAQARDVLFLAQST